jgi:hypothetical protein
MANKHTQRKTEHDDTHAPQQDASLHQTKLARDAGT